MQVVVAREWVYDGCFDKSGEEEEEEGGRLRSLDKRLLSEACKIMVYYHTVFGGHISQSVLGHKKSNRRDVQKHYVLLCTRYLPQLSFP